MEKSIDFDRRNVGFGLYCKNGTVCRLLQAQTIFLSERGYIKKLYRLNLRLQT